MSQCIDRRFLALLCLCVGACVQLTVGDAGLADDSQKKFVLETSDDASLLQISRSDGSRQIHLGNVSTSKVRMSTLGHQIIKSAINEFHEEKAGLCVPAPQQTRADERGWKSFSAPLRGCHEFWHCLVNAVLLVGPSSLVGAFILVALAVLAHVHEPAKPVEPSTFESSTPGVEEPPPQGEQVPSALRWLVILYLTMVNVNFTIMMPASAEITEAKGGSVALSGFVIGSYAIGTALSIPLQIHLSLMSYKAGFVMAALAGLVGNLVWAYVMTSSSVGILILARIICWFEGGVQLLLTNIQMACTTGLSRIQFLAEVNGAACIGLLPGPSMASCAFQVTGEANGSLACACFMAFLALVLGIAALVFCPPRESAIKFKSEESYSADPVPDKTAWLGIAILCVSMFVRSFQRVFWEAAFLYIVAEEYKLGTVVSGYLVAGPICLLLFMPLIGRPLCQCFGVVGYVKVNETLQLAGMCLMFHVGRTSTLSLMMFLFGSSIFYFANFSLIVAIAPFQARFALPHHPVLNMETIPAIAWTANAIGFGIGPTVSRMIIQACPNQNILPGSLLISCGVFLIGQHVGLQVVKPYITNQ